MPRAKAATTGAKKPRGPKAHKLADPLPEGTILTDFSKKEWKLGKPIGSGGFGLIYLTDRNTSGSVGADAQFVLKIEPHSNGPLFCELHFYQRAAKPELISSYMAKRKKKTLGMPKFIAAGSHDNGATKYRFMVMERFGSDLQKLFEQYNKSFSRKSVLTTGIQVLETLEYIHENGYSHADIKASNLLLGHDNPNLVYLVDYGLAFKYQTPDGTIKEYKEDPKRCHDGTIEFTSRDAHKGVTPSRRGDLEILGYCMLQWLCGRLPWEDNLNDKEYVKAQKIKYMNDIPKLMKACFNSSPVPDEIETYFDYITHLDYTEKPDYEYVNKIFTNGMKKNGLKYDGKLDFVNGATKSVQKKGKRTEISDSDGDDLVASPPKRKRVTSPQCKTYPPKGVPKEIKSPLGKSKSETPKSKKTPKPSSSAKATVAKATPKVKSKTPKASPKGKSPASPNKRAGLKRKAKALVSHTATQTSPGLKGLKRSRKR